MLEERFRQIARKVAELEVEIQTRDFTLQREQAEQNDLKKRIEEYKKLIRQAERDALNAELESTRLRSSYENIIRMRENMDQMLNTRRPEIIEATRQINRAIDESEREIDEINNRRYQSILCLNRNAQFLAHRASGNPNITAHALSVPLDEFAEELQTQISIPTKGNADNIGDEINALKNIVRKMKEEKTEDERRLEEADSKISDLLAKTNQQKSMYIPSPIVLSTAALQSAKKKESTLRAEVEDFRVQMKELEKSLIDLQTYEEQVASDVTKLAYSLSDETGPKEYAFCENCASIADVQPSPASGSVMKRPETPLTHIDRQQ